MLVIQHEKHQINLESKPLLLLDEVFLRAISPEPEMCLTEVNVHILEGTNYSTSLNLAVMQYCFILYNVEIQSLCGHIP